MSVRGETSVRLAGRDINLRLTLGAMAEIEDTLKVESINVAIERLQKTNATAMMAMIAAMSKAGGTPLTLEEIAGLDLAEVASALSSAMAAVAPGDDEPAGDAGKKP